MTWMIEAMFQFEIPRSSVWPRRHRQVSGGTRVEKPPKCGVKRRLPDQLLHCDGMFSIHPWRVRVRASGKGTRVSFRARRHTSER